MKTKEFINGVNELGFEIIRAGNHIDIMFNEFIVAGVYTDQMHVMTFYSHEKLLLTNVDKLFHLLVEYAETPPDEREEEKKFYLEHKWENKKFTRKEIEEIIEKFDVSWKDFTAVEEKDKGNWHN